MHSLQYNNIAYTISIALQNENAIARHYICNSPHESSRLWMFIKHGKISHLIHSWCKYLLKRIDAQSQFHNCDDKKTQFLSPIRIISGFHGFLLACFLFTISFQDFWSISNTLQNQILSVNQI